MQELYACLVCSTSRAEVLPTGERVPEIIVEHVSAGSLTWRRNLAEVDDDMESKYLKAQRSQMEFAMVVPNMGKPVQGAVLVAGCQLLRP